MSFGFGGQRLVASSIKMEGGIGKVPDGARRKRIEEMGTVPSRHLVQNEEDRYGAAAKGNFVGLKAGLV